MNTSAYYKISYGLYILTAGDGLKANGCVINTFMQQASDPMTVSVTVNKLNYTHDLIKKTGLFSVSCLDTTADFEIFRHFGFASGKNTDKISGFEGITTGPNGLPYLVRNTNAYFCCKVTYVIDLGSHTQFIAKVGACDVLSENDSLTYAYYQKNIKPAPVKQDEKGWRCRICNYVYDGENLPDGFICPVCKHSAEDFEKKG